MRVRSEEVEKQASDPRENERRQVALMGAPVQEDSDIEALAGGEGLSDPISFRPKKTTSHFETARGPRIGPPTV